MPEPHAKTFLPRSEPEPLFTRKFNVSDHGWDMDILRYAPDEKGNSEINHHAWVEAVSNGRTVGTCRRCGTHMKPYAPLQIHGNVFDYDAYCTNEHVSVFDPETLTRSVYGCGYEQSAPRGKVLAGSSRKSERSALVRTTRNG